MLECRRGGEHDHLGTALACGLEQLGVEPATALSPFAPAQQSQGAGAAAMTHEVGA